MQPNIVCIDPDLLEDLQELLKGAGVSKKHLAMLDAVPACETGVLQMRLAPEKGQKVKRAPSAYNIYIGDCMRGGKSDLKTCALEWKKKKE